MPKSINFERFLLAVIFVVSAVVFTSCEGNNKPADNASTAVKSPAPNKPSPAAAPAAEAKATESDSKRVEDLDQAPVRTALAVAQEALAQATGEDESTALKSLRTYLERTPTADDVADVSKFLVAEVLDRASLKLESGNKKAAQALISLLVTGDGKIAPSVAKGLLMGRADITTVARLIATASLDVLPQASEAAKLPGPLGVAAARVQQAIEKPIRDIYTAQPSDRTDRVMAVFAEVGPLCPAARKLKDHSVCPPNYYGLQNAEELGRVTPEMLPMLRAATLARGMGVKNVSGIQGVPIAPRAAATIPTATSETSIALPGLVLVLDGAGVRLTQRSVIDLSTGAMTPASGGSTVIMTSEQIMASDRNEAFAPLSSALQAAQEAAVALEKQQYGELFPNANLDSHLSIIVDVSADVAMEVTRKVLRALAASGVSDIRYRRGPDSDQVLAAPSTKDVIPESRHGRKESRALLVNITKSGVDVFESKGGEGDAPVEAGKVPMPSQAKRWYKGTKVFKYTVATNETAPVVQAVRALRQAKRSGTVVMVTADDDVPTSRVLQLTSAIADANGPSAQTKLSEVFPGQACEDEGVESNGKGCRTLFPVIPANVIVPSSRGLTDAPVKRAGEKKRKPEPKPAAPKLGFCNKADIKRVIRARTGSFKHCYERRLQLNNTLAGRVVGRLTIGSSGQVLSATTSGSMPDKKVHACVAKQLKKLKFKPPENGGKCVVSYPFSFKP